ncbi:MAG: nucleoside deaminase [Oscillospiraceae bacterium]
MTRDESFMEEALREAEKALSEDEIPVGAIVVSPGGRIVGRGRNMTKKKVSASAHAEMQAIEEACRTLGSERLDDCELFTTLEPCPMCTGCAICARIRRVVFGSFDPDFGALGGKEDLSRTFLRTGMEVIGGVLEERCRALLGTFFRGRRSN